MATHVLSNHFVSFFGNLNPAPSFEATASSQYNSIKSLIERPNNSCSILSPVCFLQGSYKQQTAIYTINDVDIVALCQLWSPGSGGGGRSYSRDDIFNLIAAPLLEDKRYSSKVNFGPNSMCVKADLSIKVEILPVVFKAGNYDQTVEPFRLYRPSSGNWEDGFARYHQWYLSQKNSNEKTGGNFIPAVKILKHLRTLNELHAVSFHLECLLYFLEDSIFVGSPSDYIPAVLNFIASYTAEAWYKAVVKTPCGDRTLFSVTEWPLERWKLFHTWIQYWAKVATIARDASTKIEAIRNWRILLGDAFFPEVVQ